MAILYGPSKAQMKAIVEELGESEEQFEKDLKELKIWIKNQSFVPENYNENLLPLFLRGCKHNIFRAKCKLKEFFIVRGTCDTLYRNWSPNDPGTLAAINFMRNAPLTHLTEDGCRIVFHKIANYDDVGIRDVIRLLLMFADLRMEQEQAIAGDIYVLDIKDIKMTFLVKLISPVLKKTLDIIQNAYPQRLKQIHIINAPNFIYNTVNFIKGMMKEKMRDRFIIHTSQDTLQKYISTSILPSEYEGEQQSFNDISNEWIEKLHLSKDRLKIHKIIHDNIDTNTKLSSIHNDIYGVNGSFKTLTID